MGRPSKLPYNPFEETRHGKIKVNSKTYGPHFRSPRGSKTEAKLNDKMEETRERIISTNMPASLVHNALKPFRKNFKGGLFYQYLQKQFNAQAKRGEKFNLSRVMLDIGLHEVEKCIADDEKNECAPININKNYRVSRILALFTNVKIDIPDSNLHISVSYTANPLFLKRFRSYDDVQLTFIALYPDFEDNMIDTESVVLPIRKITDTETYSFSLNIPVGAKGCMLFGKVEACQHGNKQDSFPKAMQLILSCNLSSQESINVAS